MTTRTHRVGHGGCDRFTITLPNAEERYREIEHEIDDLQRQAIASMIDAYPIGSTVYYRHGLHVRQVMVVDHSSCSWGYRRLRVKGVTRSKYWIDARQVATDPSSLLWEED